MNEEMNEDVKKEEINTESELNGISIEPNKENVTEQTNVESEEVKKEIQTDPEINVEPKFDANFKKPRKNLKGFIILFVILILILGILFALMKMGVLKKINILETNNYKMLSNAVNNAIKEDAKATTIKMNVKYEGLKEEDVQTKQYLDMIAKAINSLKIEVVGIESKENTLEKTGVNIKSYNDSLLSLIFNLSGEDKYIGEKALLDLGVKLEEEQIKEISEKYKKYSESSKDAAKNMNELINESKEIKKHLNEILEVKKNGEEIEIKFKEDVNSEKLENAFKEIVKEIESKDELLEKLTNILNAIKKANNEKTLSKEDVKKELKLYEEVKTDKKEVEQNLDMLKKQKIVLTVSDNLIKKLVIKLKMEDFAVKDLKGSVDIIVDFKYKKEEAEKMLSIIDKKNIVKEEEIKEGNFLNEKVDLEKIKDKILGLKLLKELSIDENTLNEGFKEILGKLTPFVDLGEMFEKDEKYNNEIKEDKDQDESFKSFTNRESRNDSDINIDDFENTFTR